MPLLVSVSGVRGTVGDDFNPASMIPYLRSFIGVLESSPGSSSAPPRIVIGRDTRESGSFMEKIAEGTLNALGYDTVNIGVAPTPTVLLVTRELGCRGGIAVTASHNPPQWNAFKFCTGRGLFLTPDQVRLLEQGAASPGARRQDTGSQEVSPPGGESPGIPYPAWRTPRELGTASSREDAVQLHLDRVVGNLDAEAIRRMRFRVAIDPCGAAGTRVDRPFLESLGCTVAGIHEERSGAFPREPEPLPEHLGPLGEAVRSSGSHVGFAQDPDADRLAVVDERGRPVGEEYTLVLAGEAWLRRRGTGLVCNLSTSLMVDRLAERHAVDLVRTRIGEIHVTETLLDRGFDLGGEGNGGVIVPSINPCRDSLVAMGLILELLVAENRPLSQIVEGLPSYVMMKTKLSLEKQDPSSLYRHLLKSGPGLFPRHSCDTVDGVKYHTKREWVHLRLSNTEPVVRIIAESETLKRTEELVKLGKTLLKSYIVK
jgi:phosphomannomutase